MKKAKSPNKQKSFSTEQALNLQPQSTHSAFNVRRPTQAPGTSPKMNRAELNVRASTPSYSESRGHTPEACERPVTSDDPMQIPAFRQEKKKHLGSV